MVYSLLIPLVLIVAIFMLSLRLRIELTAERKVIFIGLGRSGPEFDLREKRGVVRVFGLRIVSFSIRGKPPKSHPETAEPSERAHAESETSRGGTLQTVVQVLRMTPQVTSAVWSYLISLFRSAVVEELEGEVKAGFDEPDVTGLVYGFYHAALVAAPRVVGRVTFVPDWTGASLSGSIRLSLALPLYKLVWRTLVLATKLPIKDIYRLTKHSKGGSDNVKQRS